MDDPAHVPYFDGLAHDRLPKARRLLPARAGTEAAVLASGWSQFPPGPYYSLSGCKTLSLK